jgi:DNA-binding NtrC family response regulator
MLSMGLGVGLAIILCVDPGAVEPGVLERLLREMGHAPTRCERLADAFAALDAGSYDLILAASSFPDGHLVDLLQGLGDRSRDIPVIVMTDHANVEDALVSLHHGAADYLTVPLRAEAVRLAITQTLEVVRLKRENSDFRREIETLRGELAGEVLDLRELERQAIRRALTATAGHRARAAGLLGISERTLRNKLNLTPDLAVPGRRARARI